MPLSIVRNDITKMCVDAIVNAANTALMPGGGVCGAIFKAAGYNELEAECREIGHCETGSAVITNAFNLPSKYIIHTPGPVYSEEDESCEGKLYSCYKSSLELAKEHNIESIAFPLISAGIYGYPKAEALTVATKAIVDFLEKNDMEIYIVVYDKSAFEISTKLFSDVKEYIDENLVIEQNYSARLQSEVWHGNNYYEAMPRVSYPTVSKNKVEEIENILSSLDQGFSEYLLCLIDESGLTDAQVYKKANIDRKLFSKIRNNPYYKPSKITAVAFAIALELDMKSTRELVEKAGYSLTKSNKFDIIIEYFIKRKIYNVFEINEVLFAFDQPLISV